MKIEEHRKNNYLISTDKRKINFYSVHRFLTNSYWSMGISIETVKKSMDNSLCFGVFEGRTLIGFARVVTDYSLFGYLADVYILPEYRGRGLSKWLMECILNHHALIDLRSWMLATKDAHGLYEKFGFKKIDEPEKYMKRKNPKL